MAKKADLHKLTKLRKEEELKRRAREVEEQLSEMGQDSEVKAAKSVIELHNEQEKEEKEAEARKIEVLTEKRKGPKIFSYKEQLAIYLAEMLREENFPEGWHWMVEIVSKGLMVEVFNKNRSKRQSRRFAISGEPKYDFHACVLFAYWAGDVVYKETRETPGGIILS